MSRDILTFLLLPVKCMFKITWEQKCCLVGFAIEFGPKIYLIVVVFGLLNCSGVITTFRNTSKGLCTLRTITAKIHNFNNSFICMEELYHLLLWMLEQEGFWLAVNNFIIQLQGENIFWQWFQQHCSSAHYRCELCYCFTFLVIFKTIYLALLL